jgi:hypothetical protein
MEGDFFVFDPGDGRGEGGISGHRDRIR